MAKFEHIRKILDSVLKEEEFSVSLTLRASTLKQKRKKTYSNKKEIAKLFSKEEVTLFPKAGAHIERATLSLLRKKLDDNTIEQILYTEKEECDSRSPSSVFVEYERKMEESYWPVSWSYLSMNEIHLAFSGERIENVYWDANFPNVPIIIWSSSARVKNLVMSPKVFKGFLRQYTGFDNHQELFLAVLNSENVKDIRDLLASLTEMLKLVPEYAKLRTKNKTEKELRCLLGKVISEIKDYEGFPKFPEQFQASGEQYTLFLSLPEARLTINTADNAFSWEVDEKGIKRRGNAEEEAEQILASFYEEFLRDFLKTLKERAKNQNQALRR